MAHVAQEQELSIFAMAHRYRDRSVTQLLYKPVGVARRQFEAGHLGISDSSGSLPPGRELYRRGTEIRADSVDVTLQSVRIAGTQRLANKNAERQPARQ